MPCAIAPVALSAGQRDPKINWLKVVGGTVHVSPSFCPEQIPLGRMQISPTWCFDLKICFPCVQICFSYVQICFSYGFLCCSPCLDSMGGTTEETEDELQKEMVDREKITPSSLPFFSSWGCGGELCYMIAVSKFQGEWHFYWYHRHLLACANDINDKCFPCLLVPFWIVGHFKLVIYW